MSATEVIKVLAPAVKRPFSGLRRATHLPLAAGLLLLLAAALLYVWSHIHMTQLEYRVAREMDVREQLLDAQEKWKVELAMLKAPQRIEGIARNRLNMSYPEREQVILLQ